MNSKINETIPEILAFPIITNFDIHKFRGGKFILYT